jgi:hypothetical protein
MFFLLFLLDEKRIRILEAQKHMDPTDPDPQHWFLGLQGLTCSLLRFLAICWNSDLEMNPSLFLSTTSRKGNRSFIYFDNLKDYHLYGFMSFKSYTKDMTPIPLKQQWTEETLKRHSIAANFFYKLLIHRNFWIVFYGT